MKYSYPAIHAMADSLQQHGNHLNQMTETLDHAVKSFTTFGGQSKEAYEVAMAKWRSELSDTQQVLDRVAKACHEAADRMQAQDARSAQTIGG